MTEAEIEAAFDTLDDLRPELAELEAKVLATKARIKQIEADLTPPRPKMTDAEMSAALFGHVSECHDMILQCGRKLRDSVARPQPPEKPEKAE